MFGAAFGIKLQNGGTPAKSGAEALHRLFAAQPYIGKMGALELFYNAE